MSKIKKPVLFTEITDIESATVSGGSYYYYYRPYRNRYYSPCRNPYYYGTYYDNYGYGYGYTAGYGYAPGYGTASYGGYPGGNQTTTVNVTIKD